MGDKRKHWYNRIFTCRYGVEVSAKLSKEIHEIHANRPEAEELVRKHTSTDWDALRKELNEGAAKALKESYRELTKSLTPEQRVAFVEEMVAAEPDKAAPVPEVKAIEDPPGRPRR